MDIQKGLCAHHDAEKKKNSMQVPRGSAFFTTWVWWTVLIVVVLHVSRLTPSILAGGLLPVTLVVTFVGSVLAVMCSTSASCPNRHYLAYSRKHRIAYPKPQWDELFSYDNLSTHIFPLLLLAAALLVRPSGSTYWHRALISLLPPVLYTVYTYARNSSFDEVYNLPTGAGLGLVGGVLLFAAIPA